MATRKKVANYTKEQLQEEADNCAANAHYVFNVAKNECWGDVVVMVSSYKNLAGGKTAFADFNVSYSDQEALRYLKEAVKELEAKIAKKEAAKQ